MNINRIFLILILLIPISAFPQMVKHGTKRMAYAVSESPQITVENKYGNIVFVPWEKDSVVFDIEYTVRSVKPQTVDALFQMIDFTFFGNKYHAMATTKLQMDFNNVSNILRTITAGSNTITINYTVYFPARAQIKAENRYGNIIINNLKGSLDIMLQNGDLNAGNIAGFFRLDMSYGNANIQSLDEGDINFNSGDLDIKKANNLQIQSKLSRITFEDVKKLSINSLRDKYYLGSTSFVTGKAIFSYINIYNIDQSMMMDLKYGGVNISKSATSLKQISLNGSYSTINIYLHNSLNANFEITHTTGTVLDLPKNAKIKSKTAVPEVKNTFLSTGQIGTRTPSAQINIKNKDGQITLINI